MNTEDRMRRLASVFKSSQYSREQRLEAFQEFKALHIQRSEKQIKHLEKKLGLI